MVHENGNPQNETEALDLLNAAEAHLTSRLFLEWQ